MPKNKLKTILLIALLGVVVGGCATVPKQKVSAKKETYLKDICARNDVLWQWDYVLQLVTLKYKGKEAKVLVDSDLVLIDGERVTLSAPVRTVRSAVVVPMDFKSKVIDRLHQKADRQKVYGLLKIREIIIDAGHGGKDPGAIGRTGLQEKEVVLDISKRLRDIFREQGVKVRMTREADKFISLQERTEIASRTNADLFISVHANSSPARGAHGLEVFSAKKFVFKAEDKVQIKKNQGLMFKNLSIKKVAQDVKKIVLDMLSTHKQAESEMLAKQVAKQASKLAKIKDRGTKKAHFYVLRNTLIPSILVEVGFLTNPKEERLLRTGAYRQKVARSLAESILNYENGK